MRFNHSLMLNETSGIQMNIYDIVLKHFYLCVGICQNGKKCQNLKNWVISLMYFLMPEFINFLINKVGKI